MTRERIAKLVAEFQASVERIVALDKRMVEIIEMHDRQGGLQPEVYREALAIEDELERLEPRARFQETVLAATMAALN